MNIARREASNRWTVIAIVIFILIGIASNVAGQNSPLEFGLDATADVGRNFDGGLQEGNGWATKINGHLGFDFEKANLIKGGYLQTQITYMGGNQFSKYYICDHQIASNIENDQVDRSLTLYILSYQQTIKNMNFSVGLMDLNADYFAVSNATHMIHSSFGVMGNLSMNMPLAIHPKTALGFSTQWQINSKWKWQASIWDGNAGSLEEDKYNLKMSINKKDGLFSVTELHRAFGDSTTIIKVGAFYHSGSMKSDAEADENMGGHIILEQQIMESENGKAIDLFAQYSSMPRQDYNLVSQFIGGGINFTGLFKAKRDDILSVGFSTLYTSKRFREEEEALPHETAIELTYQFPIGNHFIIQPDFQYIIHPGTNAEIPNATVGFLRAIVSF